MQYSEACLTLVKRFEGLRLNAYQDCGGVWTIGYGHTGPDVHAGMTITEAAAEALLRGNLISASASVASLLKVPVTQGQFDALTDFCFNLGAGTLKRSTLLTRVNRSDLVGAAKQFGLWVHDGGKILAGLVARREAEVDMFKEVANG